MTIAIFKDLCADAADPRTIATFWAALLGLSAEVLDTGDAVLRTPTGTAWLWVNRVPEPKTVKNRVHVDLLAESTAPLVELGATLLSDRAGFRVFGDPEGNEFCAFRPERPARRPAEVVALCTDSAEPEALASWWADIVGGSLGPGPDGTPRYLHGAAGLGDTIWKFVPVDDPRVVKNRWHVDVFGEVGELVAAGATVVRERDDEIRWTVLADPQCNEFCAFDKP